MSPRPIRCLPVVLALAFVLVAPWTALAQPPATSSSSILASFDLLPGAWGLLARLWHKAGCILDPSGSPDSGNGSGGQRTTSAQEKEGCILDPSGRPISTGGGQCASTQEPTPTATGNEGCGIDPSGHCTL